MNGKICPKCGEPRSVCDELCRACGLTLPQVAMNDSNKGLLAELKDDGWMTSDSGHYTRSAPFRNPTKKKQARLKRAEQRLKNISTNTIKPRLTEKDTRVAETPLGWQGQVNKDDGQIWHKPLDPAAKARDLKALIDAPAYIENRSNTAPASTITEREVLSDLGFVFDSDDEVDDCSH